MASPLLEIRDLDVRYGAIQALHGVSFAVQPGQIVALLGANGAGKSTTLRTISGLLTPARGQVLFDGQPIRGLPPHEIVQRGISHVPEGRGIFANLSVEENLRLGAYTRSGAKAHDDVARDHQWVLSLFPRLKERLTQSAGTLSGGEQQMLAIGRALMARPRLLLLDEPSLGLAPQLVQRIFQTIREINQQGMTILLVEQNAHMALACAHFGYVLEVGRVVMSDDAEKLANTDAVKKAYLGESAEGSNGSRGKPSQVALSDSTSKPPPLPSAPNSIAALPVASEPARLDDAGRPLPRRLSEDLANVLQQAGDGPMSLGRLLENLGSRGYALFVVVLSIPFLLPIPLPGLSLLLGLVIALIGFCIAIGRPPWLPKFLKRRELSNKSLTRIIHGTARLAGWIERFSRPRLRIMLWPGMTNLVGVGLLLAGLLLPLPLPWTNTLLAIIIIFLAVGLMERDGLLVLIGHGLLAGSLLAAFYFWSLVWSALHPVLTWLHLAH